MKHHIRRLETFNSNLGPQMHYLMHSSLQLFSIIIIILICQAIRLIIEQPLVSHLTVILILGHGS